MSEYNIEEGFNQLGIGEPKIRSHGKVLWDDIGSLLDGRFSDIRLKVEDEIFPVHKCILSARSAYFCLKESQIEENGLIELKDLTAGAFRSLLVYIYKGVTHHITDEDSRMIEMLTVSDRFGFTYLHESISQMLHKNLRLDNVLDIFEAAILHRLDSLEEKCLFKIDQFSEELANTNALSKLSEKAIIRILERDSFYVSEEKLTISSLNDINLVEWVRSLNLFKDAQILDAIIYRATQNSRTDTIEKCSIRGKMDFNLLNFRGQVSQNLTKVKPSLPFELREPCYINYVELDCDNITRSFRYMIKSSIDGVKWKPLVDYTTYKCIGTQKIWIKPIVVKFIDVSVHDAENNDSIEISRIVLMYNSCVCNFEIENDLMVPKENIAIKGRAIVLSGVCRDPDALINGDYINYDWDSGYTCHQLGNGDITLRLNQPYVIGSFRMLLWDVEKRYYSYYIQTSVNGDDWETVVDKRGETCSSWQVLKFEPRPIVFIKIIGTHNTANEVFHCVHFECPSTID